MLILTRRVQEAFMVGDNVTVRVLSVKGNQVRIGIDAPREISIMREELLDNSGYDSDKDEERGNR